MSTNSVHYDTMTTVIPQTELTTEVPPSELTTATGTLTTTEREVPPSLARKNRAHSLLEPESLEDSDKVFRIEGASPLPIDLLDLRETTEKSNTLFSSAELHEHMADMEPIEDQSVLFFANIYNPEGKFVLMTSEKLHAEDLRTNNSFLVLITQLEVNNELYMNKKLEIFMWRAAQKKWQQLGLKPGVKVPLYE